MRLNRCCIDPYPSIIPRLTNARQHSSFPHSQIPHPSPCHTEQNVAATTIPRFHLLSLLPSSPQLSLSFNSPSFPQQAPAPTNKRKRGPNDQQPRISK